MPDPSNVLVCNPEHFSIQYSINPWMTNQRIDPDIANAQFSALCEEYARLGIGISVISQRPSLPDMVFTANAGLLIGRVLLRLNSIYRRQQNQHICNFLEIRVQIIPLGWMTSNGGDASCRVSMREWFARKGRTTSIFRGNPPARTPFFVDVFPPRRFFPF